MRRKRIGFTLVELLVVIGIISLLISILMPALRKARVSAIRIQCASNLHQWGIALTPYAAENKGKLIETVRAESDWLYYWGAGVWAYNHGIRGPSAFWSGGVAGDPGPPKTAGINKLYADGHVVWDWDFDPNRLQTMVKSGPDYSMHWVTAGGYSYTFY